MFDLGAFELLLIVGIAVFVFGPKELPLAMRTAGRWIAKMRRVSTHFRSGIDTMIREAELEEMDKKWKAQNEAIMVEHPDPDDMQAPFAASAEHAASPPGSSVAEEEPASTAEPQLPLSLP